MITVRSYRWGRWGRNRPSRGFGHSSAAPHFEPPKDYPAEKPSLYRRIIRWVKNFFTRKT